MGQIFLHIVLITLIVLPARPLYAATKYSRFRVVEAGPVFRRPSEESSIMTYLQPDTEILVSQKTRRGWKKVKFRWRGRTRVGYTRADGLITTAPGVTPENENWLRNKQLHAYSLSIGLLMDYSYVGQGPTSIKTTSGTTEVGSLSGGSNQLRLIVDYPVGKISVWRLIIQQRSLDTEGEIVPVTGGGSTSEVSRVKRQVQMISLGVQYKGYFASASNFWWGIGIEFAKAQDIKVKFISDSIQNVPLDDVDKPTYILALVSLGYDQKIYNRVFGLIEARAGSFLNAQPTVWFGEMGLGIGVGF